MAKLYQIEDLDYSIDHQHDNYTSLGYEYHQNIFNKVLSMELFSNPLNDVPMRQLERLVEFLVDQVKRVKLSFAFALTKNSRLLN